MKIITVEFVMELQIINNFFFHFERKKKRDFTLFLNIRV
jgi:hypothetical protein